ncbi:MAG: hypothetical protein QNK03_10035 [Myxococcota bacterium]|nr:hypothetical protein [Myxococcota bacterium]
MRWTAAAAAGAVGLVLLVVWADGPREGPGLREPEPAGRTASAEEFSISGFTYRGSRVTVSVDELKRRPLRGGPFTVRAVHEVVLTNLHLSIRPDEPDAGSRSDETRSPKLAEEVADLATRLGELGRDGPVTVSWIRAEDLRVDWVSDEGPRLRLEAPRAELGSGRGIRLEGGVRVAARGGPILEANRGRWRPGRSSLEVKGRYALVDTEGTTLGSDAEFVLDPDGRIVLASQTPAAESAD